MKLKSYRELFEEIDSTNWGDDDDLFGRPSYSSTKSGHGKDEEEEEDIESEDMDNLLYLLRTLFKNSGVDAEIDNKGLDITIYAVLNKKEKISSILKVFDVVKKLKKDILPQYESEFELWETKSGEPMLTFVFEYEGDDGDPNYNSQSPF